MYVQDELGHTLSADELQRLSKAGDLIGLIKDKLA
jgi:acyl carrier protein